MTTRVYVPQDTTARALGADAVAEKLQSVAADIEIIRNSSRGAFWLEPLLEVETQAGRVAFGPVMPGDVDSLLAAGFPEAGDHPLNLGPVDEIPWLKNQQRLSFVRAGVTDPLSLDEAAVAHLVKLPAVHRDPFDRMLVCQAIEHDLTVVTPDSAVEAYPVKTSWQ